MATQTGTYDFAPVADAAGKANNYITDLGDNGIRVHPLGDTDNYSAIDADGMSVVKGGTSVAHFGETARIGVESAFNTLIQAAQFAIRYATDRLFNISTDGHSTNVYMGGSTLPGGFKYTDNQVYTIYDYLTSGCTVSGHVVLDPEGGDTSWRLSDDGYGYLHDSDGALIIGPGTGEIEYLPSTGTWEVNPSLSPQSEIPGAPVSIDMGNVGIRAASRRLTVDAGSAEVNATDATVKATSVKIRARNVAEGNSTTASGDYSHAEGNGTTASCPYSHVEGWNATASTVRLPDGTKGYANHAEGVGTTSSGYASHAEGNGTVASSYSSHAQGQGTIAAGKSQTALGEYNVEDSTVVDQTTGRTKYAAIVGNGTSDTARSNALTVDWDGNLVAAGMVKGRGPEVLWSGANYMNASQTITLTETLASQSNGIVLHWQPYSGGAQNNSHHFTFVPKTHIGGSVSSGLLLSYSGAAGRKVLTIATSGATTITGDASNVGTHTAAGISLSNSSWVLTEVLGV